MCDWLGKVAAAREGGVLVLIAFAIGPHPDHILVVLGQAARGDGRKAGPTLGVCPSRRVRVRVARCRSRGERSDQPDGQDASGLLQVALLLSSGRSGASPGRLPGAPPGSLGWPTSHPSEAGKPRVSVDSLRDHRARRDSGAHQPAPGVNEGEGSLPTAPKSMRRVTLSLSLTPLPALRTTDSVDSYHLPMSSPLRAHHVEEPPARKHFKRCCPGRCATFSSQSLEQLGLLVNPTVHALLATVSKEARLRHQLHKGATRATVESTSTQPTSGAVRMCVCVLYWHCAAWNNADGCCLLMRISLWL